MRLTCPTCGCSGSLEWFASYGDWSVVLTAAARMPSDCGMLGLRYIGMFRSGNRQLTALRGGKLLGELADMIVDGVDFDRQRIHAPSRIWAAAIQDVCDADVQRPLRNHNYLLRVMQSKLAAKDDHDAQQKHQQRRNDGRVNTGLQPLSGQLNDIIPCVPPSAATPKLKPLPSDNAAEWLEIARRDLIENIGMREPVLPVLIEHRAIELYNQEVVE